MGTDVKWLINKELRDQDGMIILLISWKHLSFQSYERDKQMDIKVPYILFQSSKCKTEHVDYIKNNKIWHEISLEFFRGERLYESQYKLQHESKQRRK